MLRIRDRYLSWIPGPDFYPSWILDPGYNNSNKRGWGKNLLSYLFAVLRIRIRIRIRIHRIHMFLGLLDSDPDPLVRYGSGSGSFYKQ